MAATHYVSNRPGMASALAIITLASMLVIALFAVNILMRGLLTSGLTGNSSIAYLAAESGAERVLWLSRYDSTFDENTLAGCAGGWVELAYGATACASPNTPHLIEAGDNNYYYTVRYSTDTENSINFHVFTIIGYYHDSRRSVEIRYVK